ncbi:low affinity immunoglobulin gamma Fc region receptor II-c-like [Cyprinus carpio]|uniref:low affinity immunoglobulin gamma Fc region receptor II-c-like n=1 Tax=Cyprinus carpio TaxID=7962 RepID=UPI001C5773D2|nr:low affinity immunoglobulin gamma Fc region receptor II-c-like [Cyprinus carpio]
MTAGVDGQQYWTVNYSPSYVCALKGSTVKLSCALNYTHDHELRTVFWTKPAVTDGDPPNLCLDPENRGRVHCDSEDKDTYRINWTSVTEADKHIYYCRFTTNRGRWTGIPGAQLDVTDLQVETQQSVKERDSVTLTCKSSCSLPQQTTFIWFRNTQRLTTGIITENQLQAAVSQSSTIQETISVAVSEYQHLKSPPVLSSTGFKENQSSAVGSGQNFIISSFNSSHSGRYYCEAQNKHGSQRSASVSVSVKGFQRAALHTVTGIVVGCGGLIFIIIIIIIVFIRWLTGSADSRAPDDTYTALQLQSRSSEYETLAGASADPH